MALLDFQSSLNDKRSLRLFVNISNSLPILVFLGMSMIFSCSENRTNVPKSLDPFPGASVAYVDSLMKTLSLEEKIGQLLIWENEKKPDSTALLDMLDQAEKGRVSGFIFKNIDIHDFLLFRYATQKMSPVSPLWGTAQEINIIGQFNTNFEFPNSASLAAGHNEDLGKQLESTFFKQCSGLGINMILAPRLNNWDKSSDLSGETSLTGNIAAQNNYLLSFIQHARANKILTIGTELNQLYFQGDEALRDSLKYQWILASNSGISGLLLTSDIFKIDTLIKSNPGFLKQCLGEQLGMNGLIVSRLSKVESPYLKLLLGADLLLTENPKRVFYAIVKLVERGRLTEDYLDKKVRNVLLAKCWINDVSILSTSKKNLNVGPDLARVTSFELSHSMQIEKGVIDSVSIEAEAWQCYFDDNRWHFIAKRIYENSVTLVRDPEKLVPLQWQRNKSLEVRIISDEPFRNFLSSLSKYADYNCKIIEKRSASVASKEIESIWKDGRQYIYVLDQIDLSDPQNDKILRSVNNLASTTNLFIVNFSFPSNLALLNKDISVLQVYQRNEYTEAVSAQIIFGGLPATGKLPLTISKELKAGSGLMTEATRLGYVIPEEVGIAPERLTAINAIAESAITNKAFPGCQVLVAKDGKVVYSNSFGAYDFHEKQATNNLSLYDVASITKAASTTLAVMQLVDKGSIQVDTKLKSILKLEEGSTIGDIEIGELLKHRSGLQSQLPIGKYFNSRSVPSSGCNNYYCRYSKSGFNLEVCKGLFFNHLYKDSILIRTHQLRVDPRKNYRYSDVNFVLLQELIEKRTQKHLDEYVDSILYLPLGLRYTTFNPLKRFSLKYIIPTENDRVWRKTIVHGYVHDPTAALFGGVSGNAGLFTNAEDLAVIFQLLLNGGEYGGKRYFSNETVNLFINSNNRSERALGFDKPFRKRYPTYSSHVSKKAFGHTGFTGTCVWADLEENLIYIFLSNRINPSIRNNKIQTESIRARIHDAIYDALNTYQFSLPSLPTSDKGN